MEEDMWKMAFPPFLPTTWRGKSSSMIVWNVFEMVFWIYDTYRRHSDVTIVLTVCLLSSSDASFLPSSPDVETFHFLSLLRSLDCDCDLITNSFCLSVCLGSSLASSCFCLCFLFSCSFPCCLLDLPRCAFYVQRSVCLVVQNTSKHLRA